MPLDAASAPFRDPRYTPLDLDVQVRADGSTLVANRLPVATPFATMARAAGPLGGRRAGSAVAGGALRAGSSGLAHPDLRGGRGAGAAAGGRASPSWASGPAGRC